MDALEAIFARRSVGRLGEPAPSDDDLHTILRAAAAAPDHKLLRPLRLIVLTGPAKDDFGAVLVSAYTARCAALGVAPDPTVIEKEANKLGRAPVVVVVAAADTTNGRIPFVEQEATAAAAAQNILLAATALGYGSMWRTGEPADDPVVKAALGLAEGDTVTGFVYVGSDHTDRRGAHNNPVLDGIVSTWAP